MPTNPTHNAHTKLIIKIVISRLKTSLFHCNISFLFSRWFFFVFFMQFSASEMCVELHDANEKEVTVQREEK